MNENENLQKNKLDAITFLVIEDMDNLRMQMIKDLRSFGFKGKIFEATSVDTALAILKTNKIEFFISDWNLIDSKGIDLLKKVRLFKEYSKTPFVMCTTMDEVSNVLEAVQSGANDYIVKPWSVDELKKKLFSTWETYQKKMK